MSRIYGIGVDIIQISRVSAVMERTAGRFAERILGFEERDKYRVRAQRSAVRGFAFLATRFAAKEAFSKAIGLGMHWPMAWRAMQTLNAANGAPVVVTNGELENWLTERGITVRVTLSDEREYGVAFVIAEVAS
jgi:holo-[acyl-carrier protein] synthase